MSSQAPAVHSVHIYETDTELINRLGAVISTSLRIGDSVLIVAAAEHRDQLVKSLEESGIDIRQCVREGRYTMLDARETLSTFMRNGVPDERHFHHTVGSSLEAARYRARSRNRGLTVFGEMVALLWQDGQKDAALQLEELWNATLRDSAFHLHCAYPRQLFESASELAAVHNTHTHIIPPAQAA